MPNTIVSIRIDDYDGESSVVKPNIQASSQSGDNYVSLAQDADEIKDAILTVITGEVRHVQVGIKFTESAAAVTDVQASREGKWLCTFRDTTAYLDSGNLIQNPGYTKLFTLEIPTADRTLLTGNSDLANLADGGVWEAFKTAMDANVRSPWNQAAGAGVTPTQELIEVKYVGRNI